MELQSGFARQSDQSLDTRVENCAPRSNSHIATPPIVPRSVQGRTENFLQISSKSDHPE